MSLLADLAAKRRQAMRLLSQAIALSFALTSIASAQAPAPNRTSPPVEARAIHDYRIAEGDELTLRFFYVPELNETVTVRPDGKIHLPLVGAVAAAEQTPEQLAQALRGAYAGSLRHPDVSVEIEKGFARQQVFIGGEVERAGMQALTPQLTVMRAIILAQGMKETAAPNRVLILRKDADGNARVIETNLARSMHGNAGEDPTLQPYDVVLVPPSRVARLNKWVDQYIRRNLPVSMSYEIDKQVGF